MSLGPTWRCLELLPTFGVVGGLLIFVDTLLGRAVCFVLGSSKGSHKATSSLLFFSFFGGEPRFDRHQIPFEDVVSGFNGVKAPQEVLKEALGKIQQGL